MDKIVPDYVRIRTYMIGLIAASKGDALERIPTERELCKTFGTSRTTLRKALDQLETEGYLVRKPHFGTFINNEARSMVNFHTRRRKVVGVVLGNGELTFLPPSMMRVLSRVLEKLSAAECCGRLLPVNGNAGREFEFLLEHHQFDAFVFIEPPAALMACAGLIRAHRVPLAVSRVHDIEAADYCVFTDSFKSSFLTVKYLLGAGHRGILFLEDADMNPSVNERRKAGAMAAFAECGVPWDEKLWHCTLGFNAEKKIDDICEYGHEFTAVSSADTFYDVIREKFAARPEIPVVHVENTLADDAGDRFRIVRPSGEIGDALGELAVEIAARPFGSVPPRHLEIAFEVRYPQRKD